VAPFSFQYFFILTLFLHSPATNLYAYHIFSVLVVAMDVPQEIG
jgi:hypothetical protein